MAMSQTLALELTPRSLKFTLFTAETFTCPKRKKDRWMEFSSIMYGSPKMHKTRTLKQAHLIEMHTFQMLSGAPVHPARMFLKRVFR